MRVRLVYSKRGGACFVPHIALAQIFARSALRAGFMPEMTQGFSPRAKLSFAPELPAGVVALNEVVDMYFADPNAGAVNISLHNNSAKTVNAALPNAPQKAVSTDNLASVVNAALSNDIQKAVSTDNLTGVVNAALSNDSQKAMNTDNLAGAVNTTLPNVSAMGVNTDTIIDAMNSALPEGFRLSQVLFPSDNTPSLGKSCKHAEYLIRNIHSLDILDTAKCFYGAAVLKTEHLDGWLRLILHDPAQNPIGGLIKHMIAENIITGWHEMNIVRVSIGSYDQQKDCVCIHA